MGKSWGTIHSEGLAGSSHYKPRQCPSASGPPDCKCPCATHHTQVSMHSITWKSICEPHSWEVTSDLRLFSTMILLDIFMGWRGSEILRGLRVFNSIQVSSGNKQCMGICLCSCLLPGQTEIIYHRLLLLLLLLVVVVVWACVCMYLNVYVCVYGGQELILSVFLNCSPPYTFSGFFFESGSLIEPGDQGDSRYTQSDVYVSPRDLNSDTCAYMKVLYWLNDSQAPGCFLRTGLLLAMWPVEGMNKPSVLISLRCIQLWNSHSGSEKWIRLSMHW